MFFHTKIKVKKMKIIVLKIVIKETKDFEMLHKNCFRRIVAMKFGRDEATSDL